MDIQERKQTVRREIRQRTKALSQDYIEAASRTIAERVLALPEYAGAETVFCFVGAAGEPDTSKIITDALANGKRVGVPLCISDGIMEVLEIRNPEEDLENGIYGLLEPKKNLPVIKPEEIDFAVIPCVSCDKNGNRLGHGKGYYDRYMEHTDFPTCMICLGELVSEEIPTGPFDRPIDMVITEK